MNRYKKLILIGLCVVGILLFMFFYYGPSIELHIDRILEKNELYKAEDFIVKANGKVSAESTYLDTSEVGIHEFHYTVEKWFIKKDVSFFYEVEDTTPPIIKLTAKEVVIEPDSEYGYEQILNNVSFNEGSLTYETDLDCKYAGTYTMDITVTDDYHNVSKDSYVISVKDTEPPFVLESGEGTIIQRRESFNALDYISYGDNLDPSPTISISGRVNVYRVGKYPVHVSITDYSGNNTSWDFNVEVVNKIEEDDSEQEPYTFEQFKKAYGMKGRSLGIDVSEWQNDIDFEKVKDAGCEFVIMRIGFGHGGELTLDKSFRDNFTNAKNAGLKVGIYYYSYDSTEEEIIAVTDKIFEELNGEPLELPIVFDWENWYDYQSYNMSFATLNKLYDTFEKQVIEHGYEPMLYGSRFYLNNVYRYAENKPVWLAHYTNWTNYGKPYKIWQLCSWGQIDGIETPVDFDIWFTHIED